MWGQGITVAALQLLLTLGSAYEHHQFFKNTPRASPETGHVHRRQSPPPGYSPEFGGCGSGRNCEDACGPNWESCQASTSLSLFCYNKVDLKQTCCENGSGRACEEGYYCAWQEFGGQVWCCENGQSLEECGVPQTGSSGTGSPTGSPTSPGGPSSQAPSPSTSAKSSGTATGGNSLSVTGSQCPATTVTSWATTTVVSTVSIAATTVTVVGPGGGCYSESSTSVSESEPSDDTSLSGTITQPPLSSSTSYGPPVFNTTTTETIATAGAWGLRVNLSGLALVLLPLLWL
ncbi:uncharacterized protein B0H64DRAFT_479232 [Chaetomium fimeti]|uniref:Uncharacterized protein n=1 Tax=Chaetomium fimeti TaxID=1854472 RepID=A0AAE0H640_9PEZI|nr:hypothetical protein B0H64DRAFT_479232 [Chaetomium fimeti]